MSLLAQQTWRSPVVLEATQRVRVMVMALSAYIVLIECPRLIQGKGVAGKKKSNLPNNGYRLKSLQPSILTMGKVTQGPVKSLKGGRVTRASDFTGMTLILASSSGKVTPSLKYPFQAGKRRLFKV